MIDLYTWGTPNGRKVSIMLEECELDYQVQEIDITANAQFADEFLALNPNHKIPVIVDNEASQTIVESGAILLYLAHKSGCLLAARDSTGYWSTLQWLMFQMGGLGPMLGQAHHFIHFQPDVSEYARTRYAKEAKRLYAVLDQRLSSEAFLAGDYSIADIAAWPWVARFQWQGIDLDNYPNVLRWFREIAQRPAVQRGYAVPDSSAAIPLYDAG